MCNSRTEALKCLLLACIGCAGQAFVNRLPCSLLQEVNGKHLLKAEPLNAILDPQYFIRQVHECVVRVLNDRAAKEHQVASQSSFYRYSSKIHMIVCLTY